jgi:hypothetical protein
MHGHRLHRFGGLMLQSAGIGAVEHERERAAAEEMSVYFEFGQCVAELSDRRRGAHVPVTGS